MHSPFGNLPACRQDLETAWANTSAGSLSLFPNYGPGWETHLSANLQALQQKILQALPSFPEHYQTTLNHSFVPLLTNPTMMTQMLPAIYQNKETEAIFTDLALAILSRGAEDKTIRKVTLAYQEIIADLHHQWFRKANIKQLYQAGIVKFSNAQEGPYTYTVTAVQAVYAEFKKTLTLTPSMRAQLDQAVQNWTVPTISFPPGNLYGGLFDLATFGHEDVGHNVIHSVPGLREELSTKISNALPGNLGQYWADRVDETASDIMGILHGGPAVALAFVYSLRGQGKLLFTAIADDVHPVDVLRAFVAQAAIRDLNTTDSESYITQLDSFIASSLNKSNIQISVYETITREQGKTSAQTVTNLILNSPLHSLGNHSLSSIRKWNEQDQRIAATIRQNMYAGQLQSALTQSADEYAFHAVAAAIAEAADSRTYHGQVGLAKVQLIFQHTITILETMHMHNPRWSKLREIVDYQPGCECILV